MYFHRKRTEKKMDLEPKICQLESEIKSEISEIKSETEPTLDDGENCQASGSLITSLQCTECIHVFFSL